eukprot:scaffold98974_cov33-Phaeocystis_antarctica.AAC.1
MICSALSSCAESHSSLSSSGTLNELPHRCLFFLPISGTAAGSPPTRLALDRRCLFFLPISGTAAGSPPTRLALDRPSCADQ